MIKYIKQDITTVKKGVILHGVNCQKKMGAGIARAIIKKWPDVYESYMQNGKGKHLLGGTLFLLRNDRIGLVIANGYTQVYYGNDGKRYADLKAVEKCIKASIEYANAFDLDLYMPMIGCGLGGLSWEKEVKLVLEDASLEYLNVNIFVCDL